MIFGKRNIYIKRGGYGKAARGGVNWLKWFFDHAGFWLYLLCGVIVIFTSNNRTAPNNIAIQKEPNDGTEITSNEGGKTDSKTDSATVALIPGVMVFLQTFTSNIGQGTKNIVLSLSNLIYANEQNKQLRQDLADYDALKQQVLLLQRENLELSKLLKFQPGKTSTNFVTARVVADGGASGRQSWMIDRGSKDGIDLGSFAVDEAGLVGVITEVTANSARILRLSDPNFYLPITVANRKFRAVMRGDGSPVAVLDYFDGVDKPEIGEIVVSTGSGGNFPPFLPIGTIYDKKLGGLGVLVYAEKNPPIYVKIYKP